MRFTGPCWVEGWVMGQERRTGERKEKHGIPDASWISPGVEVLEIT